MTGGGGRVWVVLGMGACAHLVPVLIYGRAANQCISVSFFVGAEQAAEATKRRAWKDAGKRVGFSAIVSVAVVGERGTVSERERLRWWLLESGGMFRVVGIRKAARSKRQHCSSRHASHGLCRAKT
eukprot:scaffold31278_cov74-Phaeocystis_antarctica.AAC.11